MSPSRSCPNSNGPGMPKIMIIVVARPRRSPWIECVDRRLHRRRSESRDQNFCVMTEGCIAAGLNHAIRLRLSLDDRAVAVGQRTERLLAGRAGYQLVVVPRTFALRRL